MSADQTAAQTGDSSASDRFAKDTVAYLNGDADVATVRRMEQELRDHPERRREFVSLAAMQGLLEDVGRQAEAPSPAAVGTAVRRPVLRLRLIAGFGVAALAAAAALVITLLLPAQAPPAATVEAVTGTGALVRDGRELPLVVGMVVRRDDRLRAAADGTARCAWTDHSTVTLGGGSEVAVGERAGDPWLVLDAGRLTAEVTPRTAGRTFTVATGTAVVRVVGTAFTVEAKPRETLLTVDHGVVSLAAVTDAAGAALLVHAGERAELNAASGFAPRLIVPEPPPIAAAPPGSVLAGTRLFAADAFWNRPLDPAWPRFPVTAGAVAWNDIAVGGAEPRVVVAVAAGDPARRFYARGTPRVLENLPVPADLKVERRIGERGFLILVDADGRAAWECWRPEQRRDGDFAVSSLTRVDLTGPGIPPEVQGGLLTRLPATGGLLRASEAEHGIAHVIALALPLAALNQHTDEGHPWILPADGPQSVPAGMGEGTNLHFGTRLVLPAGDDLVARLPPGALRNLAVALTSHGACVVAASARPTILTDQVAAAAWDPGLNTELAALLARLQVVRAP